MKKVILFVLVLCLTTSLAFGWGSGRGMGEAGSRWKTYESNNTTGGYLLVSIPTTTIIPQVNVILGFQVMPTLGVASESVVTLYDGPTVGAGEILGEIESADNSFAGIWFPRPKVIENQLFIWQGPRSIVLVYFE